MISLKELINMNIKNVNFMLFLIAIIWGLGITVTKVILDAGVSINEFIFIRFLIAGMILAIMYRKKINIRRSDLLVGSTSGLFLFLFFMLQTIGLSMTSISNTALYTGTTALMTPFVALVISKKRLKTSEIVAGFSLIIAIYLNNAGQLTNISTGDMYVLLSALVLSVNICTIGKYMKECRVESVTIISMFACSLLALLTTLIFGDDNAVAYSPRVLTAFIYLGVFTTALAFVVQNNAVKYTSESNISFILGTESIWGILVASLLYGEKINGLTFLSLIFIIIGFVVIFKNNLSCKPKCNTNIYKKSP